MVIIIIMVMGPNRKLLEWPRSLIMITKIVLQCKILSGETTVSL